MNTLSWRTGAYIATIHSAYILLNALRHCQTYFQRYENVFFFLMQRGIEGF